MAQGGSSGSYATLGCNGGGFRGHAGPFWTTYAAFQLPFKQFGGVQVVGLSTLWPPMIL